MFNKIKLTLTPFIPLILISTNSYSTDVGYWVQCYSGAKTFQGIGYAALLHCASLGYIDPRVSSSSGSYLSGGRRSLHYKCTDNGVQINYSCYGNTANTTCPTGYEKDLSTLLCVAPTVQKTLGKPNPQTCDGNPCDASTGNKFQTEFDYSSASLSFVRYYNSFFESQSILGKQWIHQYLASLTIAETIKVNRQDGKVLEFINEGNNWKSGADITETLTQVGTLWEFKTNNDAIETYNGAGQLLSIETRDGNTTHFTYNTDNLLEQVTGPYGRTLGFTYDASNRLTTLTTPENTQISYGYDNTTQNLISVIYPDHTPDDLSDNPKKIYHYENPDFPHHLTGISDENNTRYATWAYNEQGLVILSEHANGVEKVELTYHPNETTTVIDALGRIKTYTFETHYGVRKPKSIQLRYNDGNQERTQTKYFSYYPKNGWLKELTDYNGNITYYEYNDRGLIILETQAKGTPESRTITTTWHPTFHMPIQITEPGKTTTFSYDEQGRLLTRTATSTPAL